MNTKKLQSCLNCFSVIKFVFTMGLAFWIGAHTSQGATTGTWLRCHDEVSTVQNFAWIIYKMGN